MPSEHELLAAIAARDASMNRRHPHVLIGPGDDCALVTCSGETLLTVDQVIEGRHVVAALGPSLIARKALARSLSDIAAMAGTPRWALVTGALPADLGSRAGFGAADLCDALRRWAEHFSVPVVGGDLAATSGPLVLTVTVGGAPHVARGPVRRSGAAPGDGLYVTGSLGGSLESGRHATFAPRLAEAQALADLLGLRLTSMIDLSDGLGRDAAHLARASGVGIEIDAERLPVHGDVHSSAPGSAWRCAAEDGEDYELCFTARGDVPALICGTPLTRVGTVVPGEGCRIRTPAGALYDAAKSGWDHPLGE